MILSRKWLNEFVDCSALADHDFSEAMTLSGSKVETFKNLHDSIRNVGVMPHSRLSSPSHSPSLLAIYLLS